MGFRSCTLLQLSAAALLLSGCGVGNTLISAATGAPPGLEGLYAERRAAEEKAAEDARIQAEAEAKRSGAFPATTLTTEAAEQQLYGDNVAVRFLTIRTLGKEKIISNEDASRRRETNLGALLPLTHGPSTLGLNSPVEPVATTRARVLGLKDHYPAETAFLLEEILPLTPSRKDTLMPRDMRAVTALKERLLLLEDAGLISPAELQAESAALGTLMRSNTLLPNALNLPPQETKPARRGGSGGSGSGGDGRGGRGGRTPGGVSGGLVVIPSPVGVSPPLLADNASGLAGVYLLGVSAPNFANIGWNGLQTEHPELKGLDWTLEKVDLGGEGSTYRLVAGPMEPAKARSLCQLLEPRRQLCLPMAYPKNGFKPAPATPRAPTPQTPPNGSSAPDPLSITPKTSPPPAATTEPPAAPEATPEVVTPTPPTTPAPISTPAAGTPATGTPALSAPLPPAVQDAGTVKESPPAGGLITPPSVTPPPPASTP